MSSQYKKTIVIGMDYAEFSGGITEINRKMGLLDAEFKRATAEATLFGDETGKLEAKQENLSQKIELQKKKIEEATKAYDKAVTASGYMSKATDQADKTLLNERTTLLNLQIALQDTEEKLRKLSDGAEMSGDQMKEIADSTNNAAKALNEGADKSDTFGDAIREVADFLGASANPAVERFAEKFDGVDKNIGNAVLTIGTMVSTLGALTIKTADSAKEITNVSQKMGMTTDEYQEWDYVMKTVGSDAESMTGDIAALAEKAVEATDKTSDTAKTFRLLGVNVRDSHGAMKSQGEIFADVVRGLQNMEDVTLRNAIASELLSTTGENMVPVLNLTRDGLANLKQEAHDTGYVMGEEALGKFDNLNDAMDKFEKVTSGLAKSFGAALLPILTDFFAVISSIPTPVLSMIITISGIILTMYNVGKATSKAMDGFDTLKGVMSGFDAKTIRTTAIIMGAVVAFIALVAIIAALMGKGDEVSRTMDSIGNGVSKMSKNMQAQQSRIVSSTPYYASGTDYAEGGEAWVGENGPEKVILPRGSRVLTAQESRSSSGGNTYIINATIDAKNVKDWTDVVNFVQQTKPAIRAGRSVL